MRSTIILLALLGSSVPANAATFVGELTGTVTSRTVAGFTAANASTAIKVGDTITARFTYFRPDGPSGSAAGAAGSFLGSMLNDRIEISLGNRSWSAPGSFYPGPGGPSDPFAGMSLTLADDPGAGDLALNGYQFKIGDLGTGRYRGFALAGAFNLASLKIQKQGERLGNSLDNAALAPVPEPASWMLMIAGFGVAGYALRRRTGTRAPRIA